MASAPPVAAVAIDRRVQSGQQQPQPKQEQPLGATLPSQLASDRPEAAAAFPGAPHDVGGFCVRHPKVRLSRPVEGKGQAKKYRTVRKICPQCGVLKSSHDARKLRRQVGNEKEGSSPATKPKAAVPKPHGGSAPPLEAGRKQYQNPGRQQQPRKSEVLKRGSVMRAVRNAGKEREDEARKEVGSKEKERVHKRQASAVQKGGKEIPTQHSGSSPHDGGKRAHRDQSGPSKAEKERIATKDGEHGKEVERKEKDKVGNQRGSALQKRDSREGNAKPETQGNGREGKEKDGNTGGSAVQKRNSREGPIPPKGAAATEAERRASKTDGAAPMSTRPKRQPSEREPNTNDPSGNRHGSALHKRDSREGNDRHKTTQREGVSTQTKRAVVDNEEKAAQPLAQRSTGGYRRASSHGKSQEAASGRERLRASLTGAALGNMKSHPDDDMALARSPKSPRSPKHAAKAVANGEPKSPLSAPLPLQTEKQEAARRGSDGSERATGVFMMAAGMASLKCDESDNDRGAKELAGRRRSSGSMEEQPRKSPSSNTPKIDKPDQGKMDVRECHSSINMEAQHDSDKEGRGANQLAADKARRPNPASRDSCKGTDESVEQSKGSVNSDREDPARRPSRKTRHDDVKRKDSSGSKARNQASARGRYTTTNKVRFDRGRSIEGSSGDRADKGSKKYVRSKSLPQRRQRKRVPTQYHLQQVQSSTLSSYRQAFLQEMAQMDVPGKPPTNIQFSTG